MGVEHITNFQTAAGTINTALGLGITVGTLGLTLGFVDRMTDPRRYKTKRKSSYDYLDYKPKKSRKSKQDIWAFDW